MFCNAEKCNIKCPAYISLDFGETQCQIINAKLESEEAKKNAYKSMKTYWDNYRNNEDLTPLQMSVGMGNMFFQKRK